DAFRQRQICGNLEAVGRRILDRLHRREVIAIQLLADAVLQRQLFGVAIEEIGRTGIGVAVGGNDREPFIFGRRAEADLFTGKLLLDQFVIGFEVFVLPVDSLALVFVAGRDQIVGNFRE